MCIRDRDITLQTVDGKTVIVVEVSEGRQRPYYIKALGRDGGVSVSYKHLGTEV